MKDPLIEIDFEQATCKHEDAYGSTIIFVQDRPNDGICMLCDKYFEAPTRDKPEFGKIRNILSRPPIVKHKPT